MSRAGGTGGPRAAVVAEWVTKAEADLDLAKREHAYSGRRNLDMVGFLLQQSVEKLMKAVLIDRGVVPPKTHDLEVLDGMLQQAGIGPVATAKELATLSLAAVSSRYPGTSLSDQQVADLLRINASVWSGLRPLV